MRAGFLVPLCCFFLLACGAAPGGVGPESQGTPFLGLEEIPDGPAWLFLSDKGPPLLAGPQGDRLHPRALARRARNRAGPLVDDRDRPVSGEYLALLEEIGLEQRQVSRRLNAVSVESIAGFESRLEQLDFLLEVRPVRRGSRRHPAAQSRGGLDEGGFGWHLEMMGADLLRSEGLSGQGVVVAVADTGFDLEHEAFDGAQVVEAWDFLQDDAVVANQGEDEEASSQDAHGTAVLGLLAGSSPGYEGVAPGVSLLLAKTESMTQEAAFEEDLWVAAAEWAEEAGADILSSSLGWIDWYEPEELDGATAVSTLFAQELATSTGILLVQAIGNHGPGPGSLLVPNDAEAVLSIGAVTGNGALASFSSRGPTADGRIKPDLVAPGDEVPVIGGASGIYSWSGTSLATPLVSGLAALLLEARPDWSRVELVEALRQTASHVEAPENGWGHGLVDGWAACGLACSCVDLDQDGAWDLLCGGDDCDDASAETGPLAEELCDGLDNDCDGTVPSDEVDEDGDGQSLCAGDCDDLDPLLDDLDQDGDGFSLCAGDCFDHDPATFPSPLAVEGEGTVEPLGGHELCATHRDEDCDGLVDLDDPDCSDSGELVISEGGGSTDSSGCSHGPGTEAPLWALLMVGLVCLGCLSGRERKQEACWP